MNYTLLLFVCSINAHDCRVIEAERAMHMMACQTQGQQYAVLHERFHPEEKVRRFVCTDRPWKFLGREV